MLNVSEDHSSSIPPSPAAKPHKRILVEQSPTVPQKDQNEPRESNATECVEDSYKDSLPRDATHHTESPFDANDEELYCVSPKAKARLGSTAATMSAQKDKV